MADMPDIPNWLQWLASISALLAILWGVLRYLWGRWLSDMWAKRNRDSAKTKAETLVKQYREALHLADNDRRFQAISTMVLSDLIWSSVLMAIGGSIILITDIGSILVSEDLVNVSFIGGAILVLAGMLNISDAIDRRQRFIKPYIDWVVYHETTLNRISSLLADAGLSDEEQAKFIDDVVDVVEEEKIALDEEFDPQQD